MSNRTKEWLRIEFLYYLVVNPECDREWLWQEFDRVTRLSE